MDITLISTKDAAELLNLHPNSLPRFRQQHGWLPSVHYVKVGRKTLYVREMLLHWLVNQDNLVLHWQVVEDFRKQFSRDSFKCSLVKSSKGA
ncbi:MAG: helix-turn-helix domain-containing protein [Elainellaceae cyanobacterium]